VQDLQIDAAEHLGMIKNKTLLKFYYSIEKYIIEHVNYVSTISDGMQKKILAKSQKLKQCIIFSNWINNNSIYPINPKPPVKYDSLKNKKIIFYSGSIGEKQGLEILIEAASQFSARPDVAFVIACEGPHKEKLVELAQKLHLKNVHFFNLLPTGQFNELLNASYIHLVIQKEETGDLVLPSKLTNILGVGGCAIITASEGTSLYNIVSQAKCGYIIPPFDASALTSAINLLLADEPLYEQISGNALLYASNFLEIKIVIKGYLAAVGLDSPVVVSS
jgi:colanic acid biosynthesis glycosyl transferase WcaI